MVSFDRALFRVTTRETGGALLEHLPSRRVFTLSPDAAREFEEMALHPDDIPSSWLTFIADLDARAKRVQQRATLGWYDRLLVVGRIPVPLPERPQRWLHVGQRGLALRVVAFVAAMVGAGAFVAVSPFGDVAALVQQPNGGFGTFLLLPVVLFAVAAHEAGHVFALASFGMTADLAHVNLFLLLVHPDSDVTSMWALRRRARLCVVAAGPFVSLILALLLAVATSLLATGLAATVTAKAAASCALFGCIANLLPLPGLDGRLLIQAWRAEPPLVGSAPSSTMQRIRFVALAAVALAPAMFLALAR